jgi:tripartite-type tricarboxylate transporter receptor subunit TctC
MKTMTDRHIILAELVAATMLVAAHGACAESYPEKRISLVVGFGAGGMTDVTSRMLGRHMEKTLGVPVIIENKPGAGGTLAINSVGQMPVDGYTMVSIPADGPFTSAYLGKPINLDEWAIIGGYMPQERVVFAAKNAPFNTFQEMVEYAKKSPVAFGDGASFWSARVMEAYAKKHHLQIAVVSHRSGQEASMAVIGGHVMAAETGTGTPAWTAGKAGELKILATLTPGGLAHFGMPDVPTLEKLGADYIVRTFYGYAVRVRTPPDRLEKLRAALNRAIEDPDVQQQMRAIDLTPAWIDPKAYDTTLRNVAEDADKLREDLQK